MKFLLSIYLKEVYKIIREAFLLKDSNNFEKEKEIKLNNLNSVLKKTKLSSSVLYSHIINTIGDYMNMSVDERLELTNLGISELSVLMRL